jgi:hypothetical protein
MCIQYLYKNIFVCIWIIKSLRGCLQLMSAHTFYTYFKRCLKEIMRTCVANNFWNAFVVRGLLHGSLLFPWKLFLINIYSCQFINHVVHPFKISDCNTPVIFLSATSACKYIYSLSHMHYLSSSAYLFTL